MTYSNFYQVCSAYCYVYVNCLCSIRCFFSTLNRHKRKWSKHVRILLWSVWVRWVQQFAKAVEGVSQVFARLKHLCSHVLVCSYVLKTPYISTGNVWAMVCVGNNNVAYVLFVLVKKLLNVFSVVLAHISI